MVHRIRLPARYPKPLAVAIYLFKELKLDALLHGINASGLSAFRDHSYIDFHGKIRHTTFREEGVK